MKKRISQYLASNTEEIEEQALVLFSMGLINRAYSCNLKCIFGISTSKYIRKHTLIIRIRKTNFRFGPRHLTRWSGTKKFFSQILRFWNAKVVQNCMLILNMYSLSRREESYKHKLSACLLACMSAESKKHQIFIFCMKSFQEVSEHGEHESEVHPVVGPLGGVMWPTQLPGSKKHQIFIFCAERF